MPSSKQQELFLELLQVTVGARQELSRVLTVDDWLQLLEEAQRQSIEGVLLGGVEKLPEGQKPPKVVLLQWIGCAQLVEQKTKALTKASADAIRFFQEHGFACTLLKGAAVGRYYPKPELRTSGDVDVWLDGGRQRIYDFARDFDKEGKLHGVTYHHIHLHLFEDVHLEAHVRPSYMNNPIHNRRFQQFCALHRPVMDTAMPSLAFDRVFILLHCFGHHSGYGVGLRQVMDYYFVLKQGFTEQEKVEAVYWIKRLGLYRFASGLMWIFRDVFGLSSDCLLMLPNEVSGRFILNEVMQTGNMGHGETRNWGSVKTPFARFIHNIRRDFYFARHYPSEALWQPWFNLWQYFWCKTKK